MTSTPVTNTGLYIVGEELILDLRFVNANGEPLPIDETAIFQATIFRAESGEIASVSHELIGNPVDPIARFAFPLSIAEDLRGQRGIYVALRQQTAPGPPPTYATFFTFNLPVRQLVGGAAPSGSTSTAMPVPTLIEVGPSGITISQRGPAGPSAAQLLAVARNPDTDLPYIAAPTVAAMVEWIASLVGEGTQVAADYAIAQGDYARTQGEYALAVGTNLASRLTRAEGYIDAILDSTGARQTDELQAAGNAARWPTVRSGSRFRAGKRFVGGVAQAFVFDWGPREDAVWDFNRSTITVEYDPLNPDGTLDDLIRLNGLKRCKVKGLEIALSPPPSMMATVISRDETEGSLTVRPFSGQFPAWRTSDKLISYDSKLAPVNRLFLRDNSKNSAPAALLDLGGGLLKIKPQTISIGGLIVYAPNGVPQLNPLTIYAPGNGFVDRQQVRGSGFDGLLVGGVSLLNGVIVSVRLGPNEDMDDDMDEDAQSSYLRLYSPSGARVDASAATVHAAGTGTLTSVGAPTFFTVGSIIGAEVRRQAGNPYFLVNCENCEIDITVRDAAALVVTAQAIDGGVFPTRFDSMRTAATSSGGGYMFRNCTGTLEFPTLISRRVGDVTLTARTQTWARWITSFDIAAGRITLSAWAGVTKSVLPRLVEPGMLCAFINPIGQEALVRTVLSVTGTIVQFDGALPTGFVPSADTPAYVAGWDVLPLAFIPLVTGGDWEIRNGATVGFVFQSDVHVGSIDADGGRAEIVRVGTPGSGRFGMGGYRGGGWLGSLRVRNSCRKEHSKTGNAITLRRIQSDGQIATGAVDWEPFRLGELIASGLDVGAIAAEALSLDVGYLSTRDTCRIASPLPLSGNTIYAMRAEVRIFSHANVPTFFEDTGGFVTFLQGSMLRTAPASSTAAQISFDMVKKVQAGHEGRIEITVDGTPIPAAALTANGTKTVAIDPTYAAAKIAASKPMVGVHTRC